MAVSRTLSKWELREKGNPLAVHALFDSKERADKYLDETVPFYCKFNFYMDKTLTPDSFHIVERLK